MWISFSDPGRFRFANRSQYAKKKSKTLPLRVTKFKIVRPNADIANRVPITSFSTP